MTKHFDVRLYVVENDVTGEVGFIPDDREIAEMEHSLEEQKQALQELPAARRRARAAAIDDMAISLARLKALASQYRDCATVLTYRLRVPTYGECDAAEGDATEIDPATGDVRIDERKLMRSLLPKCIDGMSQQEVLELHPAIAFTLWQRLRRVLRPNADRLPFLLLPFKTGNKGS